MICLHGESKAISIYNAAGGGSGSKSTIFENTGKVFDGDWHKLAPSARESQLTVFAYCQPAGTAPISHYRARRADGDGALAR